MGSGRAAGHVVGLVLAKAHDIRPSPCFHAARTFIMLHHHLITIWFEDFCRCGIPRCAGLGKMRRTETCLNAFEIHLDFASSLWQAAHLLLTPLQSALQSYVMLLRSALNPSPTQSFGPKSVVWVFIMFYLLYLLVLNSSLLWFF